MLPADSVGGVLRTKDSTTREKDSRTGRSRTCAPHIQRLDVWVFALCCDNQVAARMPFTLSHPAAVLPLARTKLAFSALVAGAMAPDVGYFLTLSSRHAESHSIKGLFAFCLPAGLLLLLLFHKLMKEPLLTLLPAAHRARIYPYAQDFRFTPASRFAIIVVSLLIGSATHLAWDSFTHETGWFVRQFPVMTAPLLNIRDESIPAYKLLQHTSTIAGLLVLAAAYLVWYRKAQPNSIAVSRVAPIWKAAILLLMFAGACFAAFLRTEPPLMSFSTLRPNVVEGTIAFVATFTLEAIIFSLIWHVRNRHSQS